MPIGGSDRAPGGTVWPPPGDAPGDAPDFLDHLSADGTVRAILATLPPRAAIYIAVGAILEALERTGEEELRTALMGWCFREIE